MTFLWKFCICMAYRTMASIHYTGERLTTTSREVSKPRDSAVDFSNRCRGPVKFKRDRIVMTSNLGISRDLAVRHSFTQWIRTQQLWTVRCPDIFRHCDDRCRAPYAGAALESYSLRVYILYYCFPSCTIRLFHGIAFPWLLHWQHQ